MQNKTIIAILLEKYNCLYTQTRTAAISSDGCSKHFSSLKVSHFMIFPDFRARLSSSSSSHMQELPSVLKESKYVPTRKTSSKPFSFLMLTYSIMRHIPPEFRLIKFTNNVAVSGQLGLFETFWPQIFKCF